MIASPEKRKTTAAPHDQTHQVVGLRDVHHEVHRAAVADLLADVLGGGDDRVTVGPEERRGRKYGRGDGDSLGDGLGRIAHGVQVGEDLRARARHVTGHLGDALRVVGDGSEGVHGDDDADRGEQARAREGDREQRQHDRRAAEQERPVHAETDQQAGVDGRFEADGDSGEHHGGGSGERRLADVADRAPTGLGEVARELLDQRGEHDTDGDGDEGQDPRIAVLHLDRRIGDAVELGIRHAADTCRPLRPPGRAR